MIIGLVLSELRIELHKEYASVHYPAPASLEIKFESTANKLDIVGICEPLFVEEDAIQCPNEDVALLQMML